MLKKSLFALGVVSLIAGISGFILGGLDPRPDYAFQLWFYGWMSFLLIVGYLSTPSDSFFGKIAFGFVVIMVSGIAMKIFHLSGGNAVIIVGLLGILVTYLAMWLGKKG